MISSRTDARQAAIGGVLAGISAGLFLTLFMTVMSAAGHKDVWYGMKGAAAPFLGERAMAPGFDFPAVALGLASHLAVSVGWAVAFALLFYGASVVGTLAAGVAWGFVVWLGMYYVVLPIVGLSAMRNDAPAPRAIAFHLFFTIPMAIVFVVYERLRLGHGEGPRLGRTARAR